MSEENSRIQIALKDLLPLLLRQSPESYLHSGLGSGGDALLQGGELTAEINLDGILGAALSSSFHPGIIAGVDALPASRALRCVAKGLNILAGESDSGTAADAEYPPNKSGIIPSVRFNGGVKKRSFVAPGSLFRGQVRAVVTPG